MKNVASLFTLIFLSSTLLYSQRSLGVRQNHLNVGVGLSEFGLPIYLGFDHGGSSDFTLG